MEDKKPNICRLCFSVITEFQLLSNIQQDIIQIILPELDIAICSNNIAICTKCDTILHLLFKFKSTCLEIEDGIHNYTNNKNKVDLDKITGLIGMDVPCDDQGRCPKICRTCLELTQPNNMKELKEDDTDMLLEILATCFPEVDTNLTKYPVICDKCSKEIKKYFSYYNKCMENDTKIKVYLEHNNPQDVNLYEIIYNPQKSSLSSSEFEGTAAKNSHEENDLMFKRSRVKTLQEVVINCDTEVNETKTLIISSTDNSIDASDLNNTIKINDEVLSNNVEKISLRLKEPFQSRVSEDSKTKNNCFQDILIHNFSNADDYISNECIRFSELKNKYPKNNQKNGLLSNNVQNSNVSHQNDCSVSKILDTDKANVDNSRNEHSVTLGSLVTLRSGQSRLESQINNISQLASSQNERLEPCNANRRTEVGTMSPYNTRKKNRKPIIESFQSFDDEKNDPDYEMEIDVIEEQDIGYMATEFKKKRKIDNKSKSNNQYVRCTWCDNSSILPVNLDKHRSICYRKPFVERGSLKLCKYCDAEVSDMKDLMSHLTTCSSYLDAKNKPKELIEKKIPICKYCKQKYNKCKETHLETCSFYLKLKLKISEFMTFVEKQNGKIIACSFCNTQQANICFQTHLENCPEFIGQFCAISPNNKPQILGETKQKNEQIINPIYNILAPNFCSDRRDSAKILVLENKEIETNEQTKLMTYQNAHPISEQILIIPSVEQQPTVFQVCSQIYQMDSASQPLTNAITSVNMQHLPVVSQQVIQNACVKSETIKATNQKLNNSDESSKISFETTVGDQLPAKNLVINPNIPTPQNNHLTFDIVSSANNKLLCTPSEISVATNLLASCDVQTTTCSNLPIGTVPAVNNNSFTENHVPADNIIKAHELKNLTIGSLLADSNIKCTSKINRNLNRPIILRNIIISNRPVVNSRSEINASSTSINDTPLKPVVQNKQTISTFQKTIGKTVMKNVEASTSTQMSKDINITKEGINLTQEVINLTDDDDVSEVENTIAISANGENSVNLKQATSSTENPTFLKVLKCSTCSFNTRKITSLEKHFLEHINLDCKVGTQYICKVCYNCFNTSVLLQSHLKQVHFISNYKVYVWCVKCALLFDENSDLSCHICPEITKLIKMFKSNGIVFCMDCDFENQDMQTSRFHARICGNQSVTEISEVIEIDD